MSNIAPIRDYGTPASLAPPAPKDSLTKQLHDLVFDHKIDEVVMGAAEMNQALSSRLQLAAGDMVKQLRSFVYSAPADQGHMLGGKSLPSTTEELRQRRIEHLTRDLPAGALENSETSSSLSASDVAKSIAALVNYRGFARKIASDLLIAHFRGEDPHLTLIKSMTSYVSTLAVVGLLGENSRVVTEQPKKDFPGPSHRLGGDDQGADSGSLSQADLDHSMYQAAFDRLVASCGERASASASQQQLEGLKNLLGEDAYHHFMKQFPNIPPTQDDLSIEVNRPTWKSIPDTTKGSQKRNFEKKKETILKVAREIAPRIVPMIASLTASDVAQGKFLDAGEVAEEIITAAIEVSRMG